MNKYICGGLVLVLAFACKKSRHEPIDKPIAGMRYIDLADTTIIFGKTAYYDMDKDGEKDILFSTQLVGDPIEKKDKKQWMISSSFNTRLPVNNEEGIPVLSYMDSIPFNDFKGYSWYNASQVLLAQKTITMNTPPYWEGEWKETTHRFIPFQLKKLDGLYNGWIEVSFNMENERLILHKAAVSKEKNKIVLAGN